MKVYNSREAHKILTKNGWKIARKQSSHNIYRNPKYPHKLLVVPHRLNRMVWERCVKNGNLRLDI